MSILKSIPFSYHWIVRSALGSELKTILDLGCGGGEFMRDISIGENWDIIGVDLHERSIKKARKSGLYKQVLKGDVRYLPKSISKKKFDAIFSSQVLEHLSKKDSLKALRSWEKLAKKRIVVSTPVGFVEYEPIEKKSEINPLQKHKSGWTIKEFIKRGYKVHGQGARLIYGPYGLARKTSNKFLFLWGFLSYILSPAVYFLPNLGLIMVCSKKLDGK